MRKLEIAFIGAGNMAEALVAGLIRAGHPAGRLHVSDINPARVQYMQSRYGVHVAGDQHEIAERVDILVIAVKPQQVRKALTGLGSRLAQETTLVSIVAGLECHKLSDLLEGHAHLVRVMPNTPCLVGAGMSVLFSVAEQRHRDRAEYVLGSAGETAWVEDEGLLHAVTAISGSGPAYFFLLAEIMQAAAESLGLDHSLASRLSAQTAVGSGRMLTESGRAPAELRHQVTSPGGTTQAALDVMYERGFPDAVRHGIFAAEKRSRSLSDE